MTNPPKLEIIYLPVADLVKLKGNPRIDTEPKAIERLAKLIKAHGFQNPLQIFQSGGKSEIIAGNHRFDAGLSLGMKEFPCIVYEGNRKQAMARAISDNQSNSWTDFDLPLLKEILIDIDDGSIDMSITGFNSHELELMMTAIHPDFAPGTEDDQGRLDEKEPIVCPECGHVFTT
jgi:ParB family chromosome partitioning protein